MGIKEENLFDVVDNYDVVLIGVNILNTLSNGFQKKIGLNFPKVYEAVKTATKYGDTKKLGTCTVVEGNPIFVLCYITKNRYNGRDMVDYSALESCLNIIKTNFKGKSIASTIMGVSPYEGSGNKTKILNIFDTIFTDEDVTLFDYVQEDIYAERIIAWQRVKCSIGSAEYENNKKRYFWEKEFGTRIPCPMDKTLKEIKALVEEEKKRKKTFGSYN